MYSGLLLTHSIVRYLVLIMLIMLLIRSLQGWMGKSTYSSTDNKISLWTLIVTHAQFLIGLILYFVSPFVQFGADTMKDKFIRYWSVEHITGMLIAVVLITIARATSKRLSDGTSKHKRLFILNAIALVIILGTIALSGRGFFGLPL